MTDIWGPPLWKEIHVTSLSLRPEEFKEYLDDVDSKIPCIECRNHFRTYREAHPVGPKTDPVRWGIYFHNAVNKRLRKPELPYKEALSIVREWDDVSDEAVANVSVLTAIILVGVLILG